jgi:N-acetylmuramoyl-L-alanine amidase
MTTITLSSGHGAKVQGAVGILNEVEEARRVVDALAIELEERGIEVHTYHDNTSDSQSENLSAICDWHNSIECDLAISIHFNAYEPCEQGRGVEMLYVTQHALATEMSAAVASCGLINRGAKKRTDLKFLNSTEAPAILAEICFVDSETDCEVYEERFEDIIKALADELGGEETDLEPIPPDDASFHAIGTCSQFGGPDDTGVAEDEGLAFIFDVQDAPHLFLPEGTPGTEGMGLARKLNPFVHYVACRWDYDRTPKETLLENVALVRALKTGVELTAFPADWGPHEEKTGRAADLSPGLMADLGIETDDEVEVIYPFKG